MGESLAHSPNLSTNDPLLLSDLTALVVCAGELLHGAEVGLAAAVPVAALAALARALLVLVAHLVRVGVEADAIGHLAIGK